MWLFSNLQCDGVVTKQQPPVLWCCLIIESEIQYRKPGDMIIYYKSETTVRCQARWTGPDCDACAPGWTGPACDACEGFGFSEESNCTECIQNGLWEGTYLNNVTQMTVALTFDGPACTNVIGMYWILSFIAVYFFLVCMMYRALVLWCFNKFPYPFFFSHRNDH